MVEGYDHPTHTPKEYLLEVGREYHGAAELLGSESTTISTEEIMSSTNVTLRYHRLGRRDKIRASARGRQDVSAHSHITSSMVTQTVRMNRFLGVT